MDLEAIIATAYCLGQLIYIIINFLCRTMENTAVFCSLQAVYSLIHEKEYINTFLLGIGVYRNVFSTIQ